MGIKLPDKDKPKPRAAPVVQSDALSPEDTIEYSITLEVSPSRGQKAWIKVGTTSSVRSGETTTEAEQRVFGWVEESLDRRLEELAE
jgi:hypothetical protein